eukprot:CAMPEP_0172914886 /NCGR_PEP_ID=MMETSP1075-20121228/193223_1 /TAXON_ID=2916 /ORGANISM="Ceratium fusus, Strain PA161109" /LENGTH=65 /DNA_ID=CAMNT_0013773865 /DNA_START=19 /DNA_END=213 /DNA_ORIENTATION=+
MSSFEVELNMMVTKDPYIHAVTCGSVSMTWKSMYLVTDLVELPSATATFTPTSCSLMAPRRESFK